MFELKSELTEAEVAEISTLYLGLKEASVYQHPLWPQEKNLGQEIKYLLFREDGTVKLSCRILESRLGKARFIKYALAAGGMLCPDPNLVAEAIAWLVVHYRQDKTALFTYQPTVSNLNDAEFIERKLIDKQIPFEYDYKKGLMATVDIPLKNRTIDEIHDSFSHDLRKGIKRGVKLGIYAKKTDDINLFSQFTEINAKMEAHRGIHQGSNQFLTDMFSFLQKTGLGYFIAGFNSENTMLGGIILVKEGKRMEYLTGATDPEHRKLPQSHITFFEAIKLASAEGFEFFNLGGFGFTAKEGDQVHNINQFKLNFTKEITFVPKTLCFTPSRLNRRLGSLLLKLKEINGRRSK